MSAMAAVRPAEWADKARSFTSAASDALEDGAYRARRAWKRGARGAAEYRDEARHQLSRHPFSAVGAGVMLGIAVGAAVTWIATARR
jgi:ElaB/YqjD/DUF883 family membrane-anchored ribosome-binding protein